MDDLLIKNARGLTDGAPLSIGVRAGQITHVGAPKAEARVVIDAGGRRVGPAFVESHLHIFAGGVSLGRLNLGHVHDEDTLTRELTAWRQGREALPLICGYAANYDLVGEGRRPDRHVLDRILPDQPLFILSTDLHAGWANTAALRLAGFMDGLPDLPGAAEVVAGAEGLPNGELHENAAMDPVFVLDRNGGRENLGIGGHEPATVQDAARAADKQTILAALEVCARHGITLAVNMDGNLYQADLLTELAEADALPIRVSLPMTMAPHHDAARIDALLTAAERPSVGNLSFGRVKMFMDGVFDTWTALRTDDYPDRPEFRGQPLFAPAEFAEICTRADAKGLQIATHCVGDGAVRAVIDGYEAAMRANGRRDARHRIEHLDMVHPDDVARLADLGIVASMQPVHPPGSSGLPLEPTISIMGRGRWADTFPWARLATAGVPLAFGTDWPVSPLSPMNAIHAALVRQPWAEDVPDHRLSLGDVLAAYSLGGAYADFADTDMGTLEPGLAADLILIDGDPSDLGTHPEACHVALTLCAGQIVYQNMAV